MTSFGIESSNLAVQNALNDHPELNIRSGNADCLPWDSKLLDCHIYGFILYLAEWDGLFRIAAKGDRVLNSFKMHYPLLWKWSPFYTRIIRQLSSHSTAPSEAQAIAGPDDRVVTLVLHEKFHYAYLEAPVYPAQNEIALSE